MQNSVVSDYIARITQAWQVPVCEQLRQIVHQAVPEIEERLQYGKPHFLKNGKYAAVMGMAKGWVSFTIFNAQSLLPPEGMFEASDTGDRQTIKIMPGQSVDSALLTDLLRQAADTIAAADKKG